MNEVKIFRGDLDEQHRLSILENNADKIEDGMYIMPLSEEEIYSRRETLGELMIKQNTIKEEMKMVISEYKDKLKPINTSIADTLTEIKTGQQECSGRQYSIADYENGLMEIYDKRGHLIRTRRLKPEEQQTSILSLASNNQ